MTTIAYRNGILAGDKQTNFGSLPARTTKVARVGKWLVGGAGNTARIHEMHGWIEQGMDPAKFPSSQRDSGASVTLLMVDEAGDLYILEESPVPVKIEQGFFAIGSGRDFAIMAMHLGKSAPEAVELAAMYDTATGQGVDTVTVKQPLDAWRQRRFEAHRAGTLMQRQQLQEPGFLVPPRA